MTLNVLFIVPSLRRAGAETQIVELIQGLDDGLFNKHLITFENELDLLDRVDQKSVKFYNFPRKHKYDFSMTGEIATLIDRYNIDVVHCTLPIAVLMGWLGVMRAKRKPPLIYALHTTVNKNLKYELHDRLIYQWIMRRCAALIFVCESQRDHWMKKYRFLGDEACVIHNGINVNSFDADKYVKASRHLHETLGLSSSSLVLCCVAGFRVEKGHRILVDAFERVATVHDNAVLLLAGDGQERPPIEQLVASKRLQQKVIFLGNLDDVRPVLVVSDLSILASTAVETFSLAMLESMAMGTPVVATDIGGAREAVIPRKTGALVPPNDPVALADALLALLGDDRLRMSMGEEAKRLVRTTFTKQKMITQTADLLTAVAS